MPRKYRVDPNYPEFQEDMQRLVEHQLKAGRFGAAPTGVDLSNASTFVHFRAMTMPPGSTYVINTTCTKGDGTNSSGDTGKVYVRPDFKASYGEILWGYIIVDTTVANASTSSGWQESLHGGMWTKSVVTDTVQA